MVSAKERKQIGKKKKKHTVFPLLSALKKDQNGFVFFFLLFLMAKNATLRASYLEVPLYLYINIKSFQSGQKPIEHAETVDRQWTVSGQTVDSQWRHLCVTEGQTQNWTTVSCGTAELIDFCGGFRWFLFL